MLKCARLPFRGPIMPLHARVLSTVRVVAPSSDRHLALPLAFLSCTALDGKAPPRWNDWIRSFASRGYQSLLVEVDPVDLPAQGGSPSALLAFLESELVRLLRDPAHSSPFPPLLFAHGATALLAETYVSSHPLSGLCLVSPLPASSAQEKLPEVFKAPLAEFNYEPGFPIAVVQEKGKVGEAGEHRLLREFAEEDNEDALVRRIEGGLDERMWKSVQEWMDENGL
ncbi:hypothetical protein JCM8547_009327 [Rhodosporidiobolus lusitaniae]